MEAMITKSVLQNLKAGQAVQGVILVRSYDIQLTKTGKEYIMGSLQSEIDIPFKAWNNSDAFGVLKAEEYAGIPAFISGTVDDWGGTISVVLNSVQAVADYTPDMFYIRRYDENAYYEGLKAHLKSKISDKGFTLCEDILFNNEALSKRFKEEFAAKSHHDNCKGGLLAHTYKVISLLSAACSLYPKLVDFETDYVDLVYIGALLHDIGKTEEMQFGVYQKKSIVTHQYLGMEFIAPFKDKIINLYSEDWYYELVSILLQHHGQWGMPPKTLASYMVHKLDLLDSDFTLLSQKVESATGDTIKHEDYHLMLGGGDKNA